MQGGRLGSDGADLGAWLAGLLADDATRARRRTRWLERQAAEEGTFAGVLADLGERGTTVVVDLRGGRRHRGCIVLVGDDVVGLRTPADRVVLLRRDAVAAVHTRDQAATVGDRPVVTAVTMATALHALADLGARLTVVSGDGRAVRNGVVRALGRDVVTLDVDGGGLAYVALASLDEVSVAESG